MLKFLAFLLAWLSIAAPAAGSVFPPDGVELRRTHVDFRWEPVCHVGGYELEVVPDDGRADPFPGATPVVQRRVNGLEPRAVVTAGLDFGEDYAWRVRGVRGGAAAWSAMRPGALRRGRGPDPGDWSPVQRFRIVALPDDLPNLTVSEPEPGPTQPGLTILDLAGFGAVSEVRNRAVAVDRSGQPVWFTDPERSSFDTRQLPSGRFSYVDGPRAVEVTLDGEVTWASPDDPDLEVHHEVFPMPNGNFMTVVFDPRQFEIDGQMVTLRGDRIVEFDRETNEIVWDWANLDHFSIEDMPPADAGRATNWSHTNAVVYDDRRRTVTISSRNLSRITRIDYDTGEIVFNMGREMPSGDVDFGHGLFEFQHAPEVQRNGNLLLLDNGSPLDPVTRAIELEFDNPVAPTSASIVWEYIVPAFSRIIGDADRLPNGNTLVAAGVRPGAVYEVTRQGDLVWMIKMGGGLIYRAERIPALVIRTPAQRFASLFHAALFRMSCGGRPEGAGRAGAASRPLGAGRR